MRTTVAAGLLGSVLVGGDSVAAADQVWQDPIVVVSRSDCAALTEHHGDASVAYQPGNDGVVAADLPGHEPLQLDAEDVSLDLRIPLSRYYDIPADLLTVIGDAEIDPGRVTVKRGVTYLGDHRLESEAANAIAKACAERR
ncbi:MAG: hypothetical protein VCC99_07700 [Alphaproteobacteria bacterium]